MASGGSSGGHGSSARGGCPSGAADAPPSPYTAFPGARRLADLPAVDLVWRLFNNRNRRTSDFVDVALVLSTRESRFAGVQARARAAEEVAARLRREIAVRKRVAAAVEEGLKAEIRAWQRRATEAEARLQLAAYAAGGRDDISTREHDDDAPPSRRSLMWPAGSALFSDEEEEAQAEEEEAPPLQVASGKRKEKQAVASSPVKLSKKLKLPAWGGGSGSCSNAVPESEADTTDQAEAEADEDPWPAWEEAQDALAITPGAGWCDLHDVPEETETKQQQGVGGEAEDQIGGEPEGFEHQHAENPVALAVVTPGNDLPPKDDDGVEEASRGAAGVPEPDEASEEINMTTGIAGNGSLRNKGMIYKMVFKALKEKERQATLASASQPNLRFWLPAPLPDDDKGAPQQ